MFGNIVNTMVRVENKSTSKLRNKSKSPSRVVYTSSVKPDVSTLTSSFSGRGFFILFAKKIGSHAFVTGPTGKRVPAPMPLLKAEAYFV